MYIIDTICFLPTLRLRFNYGRNTFAINTSPLRKNEFGFSSFVLFDYDKVETDDAHLFEKNFSSNLCFVLTFFGHVEKEKKKHKIFHSFRNN